MNTRLHAIEPNHRTILDREQDGARSAHLWSRPELDALILALAAERPLLVRGEPGTGKTQLARAAAQELGWVLRSETIHPRYEVQDLIWRFDAIRRLADAQAGKNVEDDANYWEPGPLWQAFGWSSAHAFGSCRQEPAAPPPGHVILLDEIDKADSDLPNSLLEVLGQRRFTIPGLNIIVGTAEDRQLQRPPLVIVTTNEERELPPAFLRRCVVLNLEPDAALREEQWLIQRARAHFEPEPHARLPWLADDVVRLAAQQLIKDRAAARTVGAQPPGPAEYLDLLYALQRLAPGDSAAQHLWLTRLSRYAYIKNAAPADQPLAPRQTRVPLSPPGSANSTSAE